MGNIKSLFKTQNKYHCAKFLKKTNEQISFQATLVSDGQMVDGHTEMHEFIGPFQLKTKNPSKKMYILKQ